MTYTFTTFGQLSHCTKLGRKGNLISSLIRALCPNNNVLNSTLVALCSFRRHLVNAILFAKSVS